MLASSAFAAPFQPTLLKLEAAPNVQYSFDGSLLEIPVTVTGSPAGLIFSVYTKDMAESIPYTVNGYLDWHEVNGVDTCIYYSSVKTVQVGTTSVTWDGKDQDGNAVEQGEYTYYIWAFDNQGSKELVLKWKYPTNNNAFIDADESGVPLAEPIFYNATNRWTLGGDPEDDTLRQTTVVTAIPPEGWKMRADSFPDPADHDFMFTHVTNKEAVMAMIMKWKFVAGGDAEVDEEWGEEGGRSETFSMPEDGEPGVVSDGEYLYFCNAPYHDVTQAAADFFIMDMDGYMVDRVDITQWWSDLAGADAGAQMNGGPNDIFIKNGKVFLNCHCSCLVQMVDPARYLDSSETEDLMVWCNDNGDYVLDHNFEATAEKKWVCNDYNVGPYVYTVNADQELFSILNGYDVGVVTFGLLGPDGTGMGYQLVANETAGWKRGELLLDNDTPFDGMYLDNMQAGGSHVDDDWDESADPNTYFLGHDVIRGVISTGVGVADAAPAGFVVEQNAPNPFNPTTTINFSIAEAGDVSIDVFNVAGQKVDSLASGFMSAGSHSVVWDASNFSAGIYFYTVKSGSLSKTIKMTLIK